MPTLQVPPQAHEAGGAFGGLADGFRHDDETTSANSALGPRTSVRNTSPCLTLLQVEILDREKVQQWTKRMKQNGSSTTCAQERLGDGRLAEMLCKRRGALVISRVIRTLNIIIG